MAENEFSLISSVLKTLKKILRIVRESMSDNDTDYTSISIKKAIVLLSIPMVLEMVMESLFAVVDIFFVAKLGKNAVSAVGLTESFLVIVYSLGVGLSVAATALVSRRIGEKEPEKAGTAAMQAIFSAFLVSTPVTILGILFAEDLLTIMGADHETVKMGTSYAQIMLGGNFVITLLFVINGIFRSSGDAALSMRVLWIANGVNMILDPILIFGWGPFPEMGLAGAAVATTTGRGIGVLMQFYVLFFGHRRVHIRRSQIKIDFPVLKHIAQLAGGSVFQHIVDTIGWIGLVRIVSYFGSAAVAGYTIAVRLVIFAILPAWGFSNTASTLVGQNLGAKQPEKAEYSVKITFFYNMIFMFLVGMSFIVFSAVLINIFTPEIEVLEHGAVGLRYFGFAFILIGAGMIFMQALNGAGDTMTPLYINIFAYIILEIPLAYFIAIFFKIGIEGVYYSLIASQAAVSIISYYFFRKGNWKLREV